MKRRQHKKAPFVITIGAFASVSLLACGGSTNDDSSSGGGTAGTGATGATGGSGGTTGGYGGSGGTTGGYGGSGGSTGGSGGILVEGGIPCPAEPPASGYVTCTEKGQGCTYEIACQSGTISHTFSCNSLGYWVLGVQPPCDKPFDSCPGTQLYCNGNGWTMPEGTNPPSPCPATAPAAGDTCFSGAFGGVWENCGYPCANGGWQVANCPYVDTGDSMWSLGPCQ